MEEGWGGIGSEVGEERWVMGGREEGERDIIGRGYKGITFDFNRLLYKLR